jgi:glutathione S-transferase
MRARCALIISGVPFELREVALRDKPAAMLAVSPKGAVPVLVLPDGRVIDESWDIMLWALRENDPENWLGEGETYVSATLPWVLENDSSFKRALDCYKYSERYPELSQSFYRAKGELFIQSLEARLVRTPFLLGGSFSLADAALLPFVRQFAAVDADWFATAPYPHLRDWLSIFTASNLFVQVMQKYPVWRAN